MGKLNNIGRKTVFIEVNAQADEQNDEADDGNVFFSHVQQLTLVKKEYSK